MAKAPELAATGPIEVVVADGRRLSLRLPAPQFGDGMTPQPSPPAPPDGLREFNADGRG